MPLDLSDPEHPKAGKPELFLNMPFDEFGPTFSPDGRWIAYRSTASFYEVYVQPFPRPGGKWLIGQVGIQYGRGTDGNSFTLVRTTALW